jgi:hypothetical protein
MNYQVAKRVNKKPDGALSCESYTERSALDRCFAAISTPTSPAHGVATGRARDGDRDQAAECEARPAPGESLDAAAGEPVLLAAVAAVPVAPEDRGWVREAQHSTGYRWCPPQLTGKSRADAGVLTIG